MQASFTACAGGGILSPLEVNSVILSRFIQFLLSLQYVSDCLGAYFWFRAMCHTENTINVRIVKYNILASKSCFRPSLETVYN